MPSDFCHALHNWGPLALSILVQTGLQSVSPTPSFKLHPYPRGSRNSALSTPNAPERTTCKPLDELLEDRSLETPSAPLSSVAIDPDRRRASSAHNPSTGATLSIKPKIEGHLSSGGRVGVDYAGGICNTCTWEIKPIYTATRKERLDNFELWAATLSGGTPSPRCVVSRSKGIRLNARTSRILQRRTLNASGTGAIHE